MRVKAEVESRLMLVDRFRYRWLGSQTSTLALALGLTQRNANVSHTSTRPQPTLLLLRDLNLTTPTPNKQISKEQPKKTMFYELPSPSPHDYNDIRSTTWTSLKVRVQLTLLPSRKLTHRPWVSNHEIWFYHGSLDLIRHNSRSDGCTMLSHSRNYETSTIPPLVSPSWHLVLETARDYMASTLDPVPRAQIGYMEQDVSIFELDNEGKLNEVPSPQTRRGRYACIQNPLQLIAHRHGNVMASTMLYFYRACVAE